MTAFVAPSGVELDEVLAAGSVFHVAAVVKPGGAPRQRLVCKRLLPRMRREPLALAALAREVGALERAQHSALPRLIDHGEDDHGPFVLESLASGGSLAALVARGPMPSDMHARIAHAAFVALTEIHRLADEAGPLELALGDLSPEDLLVGTRVGRLCFVDLGQSSWRGQAPNAHERGTLPFAPPEVTRGEVRWTQQSDVYALAAMLAFAALGREPIDAVGPGRITAVSERGLSLAPLADAPIASSVREALLGALAFRPDRRVSTAEEVLACLLS